MQESKDAIMLLYNSVYRGIVQYYRFVDNFNDLSSKIYYILKSSCAKLLTAKFSAKYQANIYKKYGRNLKGKDKHGFAKIVLGIKLVGFRIRTDDVPLRIYSAGISKASLEGLTCTACGSEYSVEMHHVRQLSDLNPKAYHIDKIMAKKKRKQIPLCRQCHMEHHRQKRERKKGK
jgi:hypothetical protein